MYNGSNKINRGKNNVKVKDNTVLDENGNSMDPRAIYMREYNKRKRLENPEIKKQKDKILWQKNKDKDSLRKRQIYEFNKEFIYLYKSEIGCIKCGEINPICLAFHHKDPEQKEFKISNSMTTGLWRLLEEIQKCEVLCHNCHILLHQEERYNKNLEKPYFKRNKDYVESVKQQGCQRCGFKTTKCLSFHHRLGEEKINCIANLYGAKFEILQNEIQKCDILCENCHSITHNI